MAGRQEPSLLLRRRAVLPYLSKVPDIEKVEGLKQLSLLYAKYLAACYQESPDILQAQELC